MERIFKVGKVLRNNWKKSVFFSGLAAWGGKWAYDREIEFQIMRAYCEEAVKYGDQKIPPMLIPRHVTVILNPAANKRKSKADYEKYCEPLLNLAGLKVSMIQTEAEGQAKDLMEIMENTDCVMIAGGDGTVHEAITGILRRQDSNQAVKAFPIGIAPVGKRNTIAHRLNHFEPGDRKARIIGESTMSLVREVLKDVNVMKIEGDQGRPVYSLGTVNIGQVRNTFAKLGEYWYFGDTAKPYLTFFFQSFRQLSHYWNPQDDVNVSFTDPCTGCSKCVDRIFPPLPAEKLTIQGTDPNNRRWWHSLLSRRVEPKKKTFRETEIERMKTVENAECDHWKTIKLNSKNILIQNDLDNGQLQMLVHEEPIGMMDFVREGVRFTKTIDYVNDSAKKIAEQPEGYLKIIPSKELNLEMNAFIQYDEQQQESQDDQARGFSEEGQRSVGIAELSNTSRSSQEVYAPQVNEQEETGVPEEEPWRVRKRGGIQELDAEPGTESPEYSQEYSSFLNKNPNNEDEKKEEKEEESDDSKRWLFIDNENYEIPANMKIELLQRRLQMYLPKELPSNKDSAKN